MAFQVLSCFISWNQKVSTDCHWVCVFCTSDSWCDVQNVLIRWQSVVTFWSHWKSVIRTKPNIYFGLVFFMTFMVLYLGTYCLKVKGLIYKQLMFMPLTFKQVYHHLTSKVTLSTGAVENRVKFFLKKHYYFFSWQPIRPH